MKTCFLFLTVGLLCLPLLQQTAIGQCHDFDDIGCDELVGPVASCEDNKCEWVSQGELGYWRCVKPNGKELIEDEVSVAIAISGSGTQYYKYGDTVSCTTTWDCDCDHLSPLDLGGECDKTLGTAEVSDIFTPTEPGTYADHDYSITCVLRSEIK